MAQIKWRPRALDDIGRLHQFLSAKNALAARKAIKLIQAGTSRLETNPKLGRPMADNSRRRELFLPFGSGQYVIRYFLDDHGEVIIVRIWHSREDRP